MAHLTYLALLLACLVGTLPLELFLGVRVYRRWRRLLRSVAIPALIGIGWDLYAVHHGQWSFDPRYLLSWRIAGLPVEEVCFFAVIPTCAILTLEAVRRRRPHWTVGDEPAAIDGPAPIDGPRYTGLDG